MKKRLYLIGVLFCLSYYSPAQIINVPGDQPTIQAGIDEASYGDTVLVAQGIYYENIDFTGKPITVASHYLIEPDSSHILFTIIDGGQGANPDDASVVYFRSGEDTTSILCGFTIQNGTGTISDAWGGDRLGGGIFCQGSGAKIIHNRIIENQVDIEDESAVGGGIFAGDCIDGTLVLRNNIIANNAVYAYSWYPAMGGGGYISMHTIIQYNIIENNKSEGMSYGGGLQFGESSGIVSHNRFENNHVNATTYYGFGGAMFFSNPNDMLYLTQNTIIGNYCEGGTNFAGGICVYLGEDSGLLYIERNLINGNYAENGGGMFLCGSKHAYITNNIFRENEALDAGGGIFISNQFYHVYESAPYKGKLNSMRSPSIISNGMNLILNNTIIDNVAWLGGGGGIYNDLLDDDLLVFNNIIYNNSIDEISTGSSSSTVYIYNNDINTNQVVGNWAGEDNIYVDPEFIDDLCHIPSWSNCVDAGIESIELAGNTYSAPLIDLGGGPRPNEGCIYFDIGADESVYCPHTLGIPLNDQKPNTDLQIFPNPCSNIANLHVTHHASRVTSIGLYSISGKKIDELVNGLKMPESYEIEFDVSQLPDGVYFIRFQAGQDVAVRKLIISG